MQIIRTLDELNENLKSVWENDNELLAYVPTMGALHSGHISLVKKAQEIAQKTLVSIFVNPLQFSLTEDFSSYPRTYEEDIVKLLAAGADFLYYPDFDQAYIESIKKVKASEELSASLCGASRPGHFDGVCSIVNHFFELIKPDFAVFGEKDYQQLKILEDMLLCQQSIIELVPGKIFREESGLAMSSRNNYLSEEEKLLAANIYKLLSEEKKKLEDSTLEPISEMIDSALINIKEKLLEFGFDVDYVDFKWSRIFVAVKVGSTRLIDNIEIIF